MHRPVVAVFDTRLGKSEENPDEAVLAYWPMADDELSQKESKLVRTARGILGLCSNFDEENECEFVELGSTSFVMLQVEPHIHWLLVAPSMSGNLELLQESGRLFLQSLHGLYMLMFQRVQTSLDQRGPTLAETRLKSFLQSCMPDVLQGEGWCTLRDLYTPMTPHFGLPFLLVQTPIFMGLQSMTASMAVEPVVAGNRPTLGVLVLFKSALLWSTLDAADTHAVYLLAARTIIPVTRIENKATEISKLYHSAKGSVKGAAASSQHMLRPSEWKFCKEADGGGFILCDSLAGTASSSGRTSSAASSQREGQAGCPLLYVQGGREACRMLTWQQHGLQVVLLVRGEEALLAPDLASAKLELARYLLDLDKLAVEDWSFLEHGRAPPGQYVTQHLAHAVEAHKKGHIQGSRYAFVDHSGPFSRSTPISKFSTCSATSMALMSHLWQDCYAHMQIEALRRKEKQNKMLFPDSASEERCDRALPVSSSPAPVDVGPRGLLHNGQLEALNFGSMGMEGMAVSHSDKCVSARWGAGCELLQMFDAADGEESFVRLHEQSRQFARTHFPGALGP